MSLRKEIYLGLALSLICIVLSACGPSPEELAATSAAETAAAATSTPTSTPEPTSTPMPTPVPYDISVIVTGEEDAPLAMAMVMLAEIEGKEGTQIADDTGQVFWYDLPGDSVSLSISAQGYFPLQITETITRGINQLNVQLERDPHGILPSEACLPNETLLYVEDFQDGQAQGWPEIESRAQGWDLLPHPDSAGNKVIKYSSEMTDTQIFYQDGTFEDAVWRISVLPQGKPEVIYFYWHVSEQGSYSVNFYEWGVKSDRSDQSTNVILSDIERYIREGEWQILEISTYEDTFEVWLDSILVFRYKDPSPLPAGQIGLELGASEKEDTMVYFDNLVVCELSEPFVPYSPLEQ